MGHIPVLLHETITALAPQMGESYLDCTFNRGGHAVEIAKKIGPKGIIIGFDLDHVALEEGRKNVEEVANGPKVRPIETNFRHAQDVFNKEHIAPVNMLLADLGLSSQELDVSGRGFTFQKDEPLVMTLSTRTQELTAYTVVNEWSEDSLATILFGFADETYSKRIARAIVASRLIGPIQTTRALREVIFQSVPVSYRHGKIDCATKTFQAIRMAVNDEVGALQDLLRACEHVVALGGRASFITFHSVEDRIVKHFFNTQKDMWQAHTKKPVTPTDEEIRDNPRSRSAKLRTYTKIM